MSGRLHSLIYVISLLAIATSVTEARAQTKGSAARGSFDQSHNNTPPPPSAKQLWDWYGEASKLHDQGKVDEAWKVYKRIWEHKKTYDVAASMGEVSAKRGEYAQAARYYRFALETVVPTQSPDFVEAVKEELQKALAQVTEVELNVATTDAAATELHVIDEKSQRELELPLFLEPGHYRLKAQAPGFAPRFKTIAATAGRVVQWQVDLVPLRTTAATHDRTVKTRHPGLVFGIGGLVTVGLGATSYLLAREARSEYNAGIDLGADLSENECIDGDRRCSQIQKHGDAADRYQKLSWLSAGGAGLAAIATIVTYVLWEDTEPLEVSFESPGGDGLKVGWTHAF